MIPRSNSCFLPSDLASSPSSDSQSLLGYVDLNPASLISFVDHSSTLLYSLSILKERVHQAQSLVSTLLASPVNGHLQVEAEPAASMVFRVSNLVQEIHSVSSSLMFTFQQLSLDPNLGLRNPYRIQVQNAGDQSLVVGTSEANKLDNNSIFGSTDEHMKWFGAGLSYDQTTSNIIHPERFEPSRNPNPNPSHDAMIIEMDAADLLAKYTHYCQVCNKGFKRDANLRMHMRAHGDEYKSNASLTNPAKNNLNSSARRYSCPQDGCRWNRRHPKFQPLKSMICVKNHYKRSHCPKMYVCKRCNHKDFSVVSDLRTHEKHCGDLKWRCSCGTTFSRKDKLMGHVGLFAGHVPASFDI